MFPLDLEVLRILFQRKLRCGPKRVTFLGLPNINDILDLVVWIRTGKCQKEEAIPLRGGLGYCSRASIMF